jgi:hypothetical protein
VRRRRWRNWAREHSQGGDTGSNPVGTTHLNMQVTGQIRTDVSHEQATPAPIDPVNIPWQVGTRRLHRRSVMPERARRFALHPVGGRNTPSGRRVSTCMEWRHAHSVTRSRIAGFVSAFVGDLVGASTVTGRPWRDRPDDGDQRNMSLIQSPSLPMNGNAV